MNIAQRTTGMGGHHSARMIKDEWLTPPDLVKRLGPFDLDPCSPGARRPWDTAKEHYSLPDDGLSLPWWGRIWLNPPYGKFTGRWLERLAVHGNGVALIFARTETDMFFRQVWGKASSVLFLRGRLHFHHVDGNRAVANAGAPSVLVAYGDNNTDVLRECCDLGQFVFLRSSYRDDLI